MKIENLTSNHPDFLPRQSIGMKNRYYLLNLVPVVNNYLKVLHTAYCILHTALLLKSTTYCMYCFYIAGPGTCRVPVEFLSSAE